MLYNKKDLYGAIFGAIVGDALGVPVEFKSREELDKNPITDMVGHGTYNQEKGTWSDDSSLILATLDNIGYDSKIDYNKIMEAFLKWKLEGKYTQDNRTFDIGKTTRKALDNYLQTGDALKSGPGGFRDNGNGSLMRIIPLLFKEGMIESPYSEDSVEKIFNLSTITHSNIISKLACLLYIALGANIIKNKTNSLKDLIEKSIEEFNANTSDKYGSQLSDEFQGGKIENSIKLKRDELRSSGYVVSTLESVLNILYNTNNYKEAMIMAVNLGKDTDTIASIAGGLAGLYYGYDDIPKSWISVIRKRELVEFLIEKFLKTKNEK